MRASAIASRGEQRKRGRRTAAARGGRAPRAHGRNQKAIVRMRTSKSQTERSIKRAVLFVHASVSRCACWSARFVRANRTAFQIDCVQALCAIVRLRDMADYLTDTFAPASSSSFLSFSASSLEMPSLILVGAPSTASLASLSPGRSPRARP